MGGWVTGKSSGQGKLAILACMRNRLNAENSGCPLPSSHRATRERDTPARCANVACATLNVSSRRRFIAGPAASVGWGESTASAMYRASGTASEGCVSHHCCSCCWMPSASNVVSIARVMYRAMSVLGTVVANTSGSFVRDCVARCRRGLDCGANPSQTGPSGGPIRYTVITGISCVSPCGVSFFVRWCNKKLDTLPASMPRSRSILLGEPHEKV
jgi:hypothetical protein